MTTARTAEPAPSTVAGPVPTSPDRRVLLVSLGSLAAALASTSCCLLPLALFAVGAGGAWIGRLTALAPYQPVFLVITLACLAVGFRLVSRASVGCAPASACARPVSSRFVTLALWIATLLVVAALAFPFVVRPFVGG